MLAYCAVVTVRRATRARTARRPTCPATPPRARMAASAVHSALITIPASVPQVDRHLFFLVLVTSSHNTLPEPLRCPLLRTGTFLA
jgi:hypothetical protein